MRVAHVAHLEQPAVLPFICVDLQLQKRNIKTAEYDRITRSGQTDLIHHGISVLLCLLGDFRKGGSKFTRLERSSSGILCQETDCFDLGMVDEREEDAV